MSRRPTLAAGTLARTREALAPQALSRSTPVPPSAHPLVPAVAGGLLEVFEHAEDPEDAGELEALFLGRVEHVTATRISHRDARRDALRTQWVSSRERRQVTAEEALLLPALPHLVKSLFNNYFRNDLYGDLRSPDHVILSSGAADEELYGLPSVLKECIHIALERDWYGYSDSLGRDSARAAIARLENQRTPGADYSERQVAITLGGTAAISSLVDFLTTQGFRSGLCAIPNYPPLVSSMSRRMATTLVPVKCSDGMTDIRPLIEQVARADLVLLQTVTNPTGTPVPEHLIAELIDTAPPGCVIVLDECHECLGYDIQHCAQRADPRVVRVVSLSKEFSAPGLKAGWMTASESLLRQYYEHASTSFGGPASIFYLLIEVIAHFERWRREGGPGVPGDRMDIDLPAQPGLARKGLRRVLRRTRRAAASRRRSAGVSRDDAGRSRPAAGLPHPLVQRRVQPPRGHRRLRRLPHAAARPVGLRASWIADLRVGRHLAADDHRALPDRARHGAATSAAKPMVIPYTGELRSIDASFIVESAIIPGSRGLLRPLPGAGLERVTNLIEGTFSGDGPLRLGRSQSLIVLAVDAVGVEETRSVEATFSGVLTSTFPSTSVVAWRTALTGLPPARHGVPGVVYRDPEHGVSYHSFRDSYLKHSEDWALAQDARGVVRLPRCETVFERLGDRGITSFALPAGLAQLPSRWLHDLLTGATIRPDTSPGGTPFDPAQIVADAIARVTYTLRSTAPDHPRLIWTWINLDDVMHAAGPTEYLRAALRTLGDAAARWAEQGHAVVLHSDHGMTPCHTDATLEDEWASLNQSMCVLGPGGAGRTRWCYPRPGRTGDLTGRIQALLPDALVGSPQELAELGLLSRNDPAAGGRIGEIVVVARSARFPAAMDARFEHGSATAAEMMVPLIWWQP